MQHFLLNSREQNGLEFMANIFVGDGFNIIITPAILKAFFLGCARSVRRWNFRPGIHAFNQQFLCRACNVQNLLSPPLPLVSGKLICYFQNGYRQMPEIKIQGAGSVKILPGGQQRLGAGAGKITRESSICSLFFTPTSTKTRNRFRRL